METILAFSDPLQVVEAGVGSIAVLVIAFMFVWPWANEGFKYEMVHFGVTIISRTFTFVKVDFEVSLHDVCVWLENVSFCAGAGDANATHASVRGDLIILEFRNRCPAFFVHGSILRSTHIGVK